jgi:hypothetical protein
MGCLLSKKGEKLDDEEPEVFSWQVNYYRDESLKYPKQTHCQHV